MDMEMPASIPGFFLVKLGSESRPATDEDIKHVQETLDQFLGNKLGAPVIVTHHTFDIEWVTNHAYQGPSVTLNTNVIKSIPNHPRPYHGEADGGPSF